MRFFLTTCRYYDMRQVMEIKTIRDIHVIGEHCSPEGQRSPKRCQYLSMLMPGQTDTHPIKFICTKYDAFLKSATMGKRIRTNECISEYGT